VATTETIPTKPLTTSEVVERLGVSPQTVRRLADAGELPHFRLTPRSPRRFRCEDVDRLLQASFIGAVELEPAA
jgi:excisionase family DNA binding protein